jgi:aryl-alcohol dehydrogenase-like predicted oxidoreductase
MKNSQQWNRREFIAKPAALLAATHLLGNSALLLGEALQAKPVPAPAGTSPKTLHRTLGKTNVKLPIVSMGVMNADVPGLVRRSYEIGVRHFDTAAGYQQGRNEEMVGSVIKEMGVRDNVIISTKIARPGRGREGGAQPSVLSPADEKARFLEAFAGCLKRLQMDHVDILYAHSCDSEADVNAEGVLEALTQLKKEGKTRFIGASSHQAEMALKQAMKLDVYDVMLIPMNYTMASSEGLQKWKDEAAKFGLKLSLTYEGLAQAIDEAAQKGIGIVAMKTQAGGVVRPDPKSGKPLPPASQTAALKWVLRHPSITTAIPGYTTYEQMEQNFSVASNLDFTPAEEDFLSGKNTVAEAQFCRQCGQCVVDCPLGVNIPQLMRSHMYAVQYANYSLAAQTMTAISNGKGLAACGDCEACAAKCRNSVNIAMKIRHLKEISSIGRLSA